MITRKQARAAIRLAKRGMLDLQVFVDALASDYVRAQAELEGLVLEAMVSGDLKKVKERKLRLAKVRKLMTNLERRTPLKVRRLMREAFRMGERTTRTATSERAPDKYGILRKQSIDALSAGLEAELKAARDTTEGRVASVIRQEGLRAAAQAVSAEDEGIAAASQAMQRRLTKQGVTSFTDKGGRVWSLDTYANMKVRTEATNAMAQGAENSMLVRDMDLVEVHSGESACPICTPFQGGPWSLTGRAKGVKRLERLPSYHGNCDCVVTPHRDAFDEREQWRERQAA